MYLNEAKQIIQQSITPYGYLASVNNIANYQRVWSRDATMTGIASMLVDKDYDPSPFLNSITYLCNSSTEWGQIPSNISVIEKEIKPSYGSLVGRVDATTWWIVGACILAKKDIIYKAKYAEKIERALSILNAWEMNNRDLLYTPLGGNWADEYITYGYTLYDNCLRYWALDLAGKLYNNNTWKTKAERVKLAIEANFNPHSTQSDRIHPLAFDKINHNSHLYWMSSFSPNGYNTRWDMAGNALAILLGLCENSIYTIDYIQSLNRKYQHWLLPTFYPVIDKSDKDWTMLENNYSYQFKNEPYHFHNGGSWPIFLGWLSLALRIANQKPIADNIKNELENNFEKNPEYRFAEYWDIRDKTPHGTNHLCFSAAGYLLMSTTDLEHIKTTLF